MCSLLHIKNVTIVYIYDNIASYIVKNVGKCRVFHIVTARSELRTFA